MTHGGYQACRRTERVVGIFVVLVSLAYFLITLRLHIVAIAMAAIMLIASVVFLIVTLLDRPRLPLTKALPIAICSFESFDNELPWTTDQEFESETDPPPDS